MIIWVIWWLFGLIIWLIIRWLFDDYLFFLFDDYLMIIWLIIRWIFGLFDDYLIEFFGDYLMIIWLDYLWLFGDYLILIIRDYSLIWSWLFVIIHWLFALDYSWLFVDYLILIIRDYSWLFGFWTSSRLVCLLHSQKPSHRTAWWWQPFACANHSLRVSPASYCISTRTTLFSFKPTSTRRTLCPALPTERYWTQPSRNFWRYPAPSSRISFAMESRLFTHVLSGIPMSTRTCNNQNNHNHCNNHKTLMLVFWLATFSACSALLKPKCQKMSSTRCNIFSLKR